MAAAVVLPRLYFYRAVRAPAVRAKLQQANCPPRSVPGSTSQLDRGHPRPARELLVSEGQGRSGV